MCDSLSSVWDHSVHFAKFSPMLGFSKGYNNCSPSFHPTSTNFMKGIVIRVEYRQIYFWRSAKFKNSYSTLEFLSSGPNGLKISTCYSYSFHLILATPYEDIGCYGRVRAITFLGNRPNFKNLGVNGKIRTCILS